MSQNAPETPEGFDPGEHLREGDPDRVDDRDFWRAIRRYGRKIPFAGEVVAAFYAMRDSRVPAKERAIIAAGIAYLILPIDFIPEAFLGGFGLGDDIAVLWQVVRRVNHIITEEHRARAKQFLTAD